jgi:ATP-dependent Lon protease
MPVCTAKKSAHLLGGETIVWNLDDLSFSPESFSGQVRLFPLPNLVMFPSVMQPLHVFEPCYLQLVEDALAGDRLIAMGLLMPGWQRDYDGRPAIAPVACLGKIVSCQKQDDGTYNILLLGVRRARIQSEFTTDRLYRSAFVELLEDVYPASSATEGFLSEQKIDPETREMQEQLLASFQQLLPKLPVESEPLEDLIANQISLGMLTDIIAYTLDIGLRVKQKLLSESRVLRRAQTVLGELSVLAHPAELADQERHQFPPKFSLN